jgi:hypothetical protein
MDRAQYFNVMGAIIDRIIGLPNGVTMDPKETEAASAAHYKAPRISLSDIEAEILCVAYMDGGNFLTHATIVERDDKTVPPDAHAVTICMVTLKNGWVLVGMSAPASPENFDAAHGRKLAYDRCIMQIWPLMGYTLKEQLHRTR